MIELNLCEILKGHEGETFYSPIFGCIKLHSIYQNEIFFYRDNGRSVSFYENGKYFNSCPDAECLLFPSKEQRDWRVWEKDNDIKVEL